jgi:restriction system protein
LRLSAAEQVLRGAEAPRTARQITEEALSRELWATTGKTPEQTMAAQLSVDIRDYGPRSRFRRAAPGQFELNPDHCAAASTAAPPASRATHRRRRSAPRRMSFLDAAEDVLRRSPDHTPMHYRQITEQALVEGLIESAGRTPRRDAEGADRG